MFPLIGLLFLIAIAGVFAGFVSIFSRKTRRLSAYLLLSPFCAAFFAFWGLWGGGFLVEHFMGPTRLSTLAALLGVLSGFALGGWIGFLFARGINRHLFRTKS